MKCGIFCTKFDAALYYLGTWFHIHIGPTESGTLVFKVLLIASFTRE